MGWFETSSGYWLVLEIKELDDLRHLPGSMECLQRDLLLNCSKRQELSPQNDSTAF